MKTILTQDLPEKNTAQKALKVFAKTKYGDKMTQEEFDALSRDYENEVGSRAKVIEILQKRQSH